MIRHLVVSKLKPDIPPDEINAILAGLQALAQQVVEIRAYEYGLDAWHGERSYDFGLVATFDDIEGLARYQEHPAHLAVARRLRAASEHLVTVDLKL